MHGNRKMLLFRPEKQDSIKIMAHCNDKYSKLIGKVVVVVVVVSGS